MENQSVYFWTATIFNWHQLLMPDSRKEIIINSLLWLKQERLAEIYAYVIMPNHIHLIWQTLPNNRKESVQGSFLKFTAHEFRKGLIKNDRNTLQLFSVHAPNKSHEFWQRDSLAIQLFSREVAYQKLHYIHQNPVSKHWNLSEDFVGYRFSSAGFYEGLGDPFNLVTHINKVI